MRKQFPVPKGLRSRSFASRYSQLRKLRKLANRRDRGQKESNLIPSGERIPLPDRNRSGEHHKGTSFGTAVAIGLVLLAGFFVWLGTR